MLYYCWPLQGWSAADILLLGSNTGVHDVFIPQCGINVFVDRCDLARCPYTYFLRYAALYLGRTFFCIKEGNHELIRRLYQKIASDCLFRFDDKVSMITGHEQDFFVHLASGTRLGPFHQVITACQPHQVAAMLPSHAYYDRHRECVGHFECVVAHSAVHTDSVPFERADDSRLELGVLYDRTLGDKQHHYLHINPAQFYSIEGLPKHTFVTVSYDDADPTDVIASHSILNSFQTTLSRMKVDSQRDVPRLVQALHHNSHGIHMANAAFLGLMWHEDGLTMAELACAACLENLQRHHARSQCVDAAMPDVMNDDETLGKSVTVEEATSETTIDTKDSTSDSGHASLCSTASLHDLI